MAIPTYVGNPTESARGAQLIARKGVPVFPVNGKTPLVRWRDRATTNPVEVSRLWRNSPHAGIGIPTGPKSGFFVLDIDRQSAIAELPGSLPRTLTARTKNGGLHFYFKHAEGVRNSAGDIAEDVDVRGAGGFVVSPPSPGYTWVDLSEIADAPEWLLELIFEKQKKERVQLKACASGRALAVDLDSIEPIYEGARNNSLASVAGRLHDGRDLAALEAALLEVNASRCTPPLPEAEVVEIARSIYQRDPCTPGKGSNRAEVEKKLGLFECAMLCHPWGRWPGGLSATKALLRKAREFGRLRPDGKVELNLSYNEFALEAATSERSIKRYAKKIKPTGLVSQDNAERKAKEATTWVLNIPARGDTTRLQNKYRDTLGCRGDTSRTLPLTRPRLRYSERFIQRFGKSWERARDVLEAAGGSLGFRAFAEATGMNPNRIRELCNPRPGGWLDRARRDGLVRVTSGGLQLLEGWEGLEDRMRERTGEIAAYTRDKEAYKRKRLDWLDRLNHNKVVERPMSEAERNARSELAELREAGRQRWLYRRKMKDFRAERKLEERRKNRSYRITWAIRAMTNPETTPGMITESYFFGDTDRFDSIVGAVAELYKDGDNWRAWREDVREAFSEIAPDGLVVCSQEEAA